MLQKKSQTSRTTDVDVFGLLNSSFKEVIIIKVQGGLGNQLLQYSIGRVLTVKYSKEVLYDLSFFEEGSKFTKRPYLLDKFATVVHKATKEEIKKVRYPFFFSRSLDLIYRFFNRYFFKNYYVGYSPSFFSSVAKKQNAYLEGFWQSYVYYKEDLSLLTQEICLTNSSRLEQYQQKVSFSETVSVGVHIRRGDYLNKGSGVQVLTRAYYEKAVKTLESKVGGAVTYYVFSDDSQWVKEELGTLFPGAVYVSDAKLADYEEFALLKDCQHVIIGNSTFSWYAALLNDRPEKVVVYSKDWKNPFLNHSINICPEHWEGLAI